MFFINLHYQKIRLILLTLDWTIFILENIVNHW